MNTQDRIAEIILPLLDALMNIVTLGAWSRIRGESVPQIRIKDRK